MAEIIYDASREHALNLYVQLQMLEDGGKNVGEIKEEVWQQILRYAEEDDQERLARLRADLQTLVGLKEELAQVTEKP